MSVTRLLVYDYLSPDPANEVIRMLLILLCPPVGTSVVPPTKNVGADADLDSGATLSKGLGPTLVKGRCQRRHSNLV